MKLPSAIIFFISLLLFGISAKGQVIEEDTSTNEPFFKAKRFNSRCYVGFEGTAMQLLKNKAVMNSSIDLNWVVNHKYVVTARFHVLSQPVNVQPIVEPDLLHPVAISLSHQSAELGFSYIFFDNKTFSIQPELSAGWGDVKYKIEHATYLRSFGIIEPAVYGIYNATKFFRFGVGLSYQAALGCKANGLTDAHLSGIGGLLFIRFGTF